MPSGSAWHARAGRLSQSCRSASAWAWHRETAEPTPTRLTHPPSCSFTSIVPRSFVSPAFTVNLSVRSGGSRNRSFLRPYTLNFSPGNTVPISNSPAAFVSILRSLDRQSPLTRSVDLVGRPMLVVDVHDRVRDRLPGLVHQLPLDPPRLDKCRRGRLLLVALQRQRPDELALRLHERDEAGFRGIQLIHGTCVLLAGLGDRPVAGRVAGRDHSGQGLAVRVLHFTVNRDARLNRMSNVNSVSSGLSFSTLHHWPCMMVVTPPGDRKPLSSLSKYCG